MSLYRADVWYIFIAFGGWFTCGVLPVTCFQQSQHRRAVVYFSDFPKQPIFYSTSHHFIVLIRYSGCRNNYSCLSINTQSIIIVRFPWQPWTELQIAIFEAVEFVPIWTKREKNQSARILRAVIRFDHGPPCRVKTWHSGLDNKNYLGLRAQLLFTESLRPCFSHCMGDHDQILHLNWTFIIVFHESRIFINCNISIDVFPELLNSWSANAWHPYLYGRLSTAASSERAKDRISQHRTHGIDCDPDN